MEKAPRRMKQSTLTGKDLPDPVPETKKQRKKREKSEVGAKDPYLMWEWFSAVILCMCV